MNIALQVSDLDHPRIDGTRVYLKELLARFGPLSPATSFHLYHRGTFNPALAPPESENYFEHTVPFPIAWMQTRFAWEMFRVKPDKLFLPIQAAPLFLPKDIEVTATIHDLAFKRYPETFPPKHVRKLNFLLDVVVKRADKLIAVSESTKKDLLKFYPTLPTTKIRVIHHGFSQELYGQAIPSSELMSTLQSFQLEPKTYALYVGALQPRKNLVRLIQAFERVKKDFPEMRLVLAGEAAWLSKDILQAVEGSAHRRDIILTGRVSFAHLRALYQGAKVFVFPSLYEGFGIPLLEAFASNIPVLTAKNSSLGEVAGDGALYCDAMSVDDITSKLSLLWQDATLQQSLIEKGKERLKHFSWDTCARETLEYIQN